MYFLRSRRRAHRGVQGGVGRDRRLDRRRRRRRALELPRPHQRHRRRDRGRARPRRPAAADPRHRPVRGGRRGARRSARRSSSRRCPATARRRPSELPALTCAVVAVASGDGHRRVVRPARRAGHRDRRADDEPVDRRPARRRRSGPTPSTSWCCPNNKNIIPVAEQVDALTAKTVRVVPTRSMPEGLAALDRLRPGGRRTPPTPGRCATPARRSRPAR